MCLCYVSSSVNYFCTLVRCFHAQITVLVLAYCLKKMGTPLVLLCPTLFPVDTRSHCTITLRSVLVRFQKPSYTVDHEIVQYVSGGDGKWLLTNAAGTLKRADGTSNCGLIKVRLLL